MLDSSSALGSDSDAALRLFGKRNANLRRVYTWRHPTGCVRMSCKLYLDLLDDFSHRAFKCFVLLKAVLLSFLTFCPVGLPEMTFLSRKSASGKKFYCEVKIPRP